MKFDELLTLVGPLPWFDLATLVQLTDEPRERITNQLYRFSKAGKLIPLKRGMYVLAQQYRQTRLQPAALAGIIYRPSYLSGVWALSHYGLIPESVPVFTSVTPRTPKFFTNAFVHTFLNSFQRKLFSVDHSRRSFLALLHLLHPGLTQIDLFISRSILLYILQTS